MKWITTKAAKNRGKDVKIGTKGEGDIPLYLVGKVAVLPDEVLDLNSADDSELDLTDRGQIAKKLKELGIEFDGRKSAKELAELLPKE